MTIAGQAFSGTITIEQIGQYHSVFFYFPILFFTLALIADVFNYFGRTIAFKIGHWFVIIGVVMCVPTLITGLAAEANFDPNDPFLAKHRFLGYATEISGSFYAGLRISSMYWTLPLKPSHYIGLSILMVALVSWTSDYGGLIRHLA